MDQAAADRKNPAWVVFGKSVRGASHRKSGLPNQDAIGWFRPEELPRLAHEPLGTALAEGMRGARA